MSDEQDYKQVVREVAENLIDEMREEFKGGVTGERLREELMERIHQNIDGNSWIIYTHYAMKILALKGTDAYTDSFGTDGLVKDGDINYGAIAFAAMEQDVMEDFGRLDFDPNEPTAFFEDEQADEVEAKS